ncbi:MAG TPA: ABC transporter permease [Actinomycetota bacterium]|nr:ABC transporter permease [Actinomycetota bacterium]
MIRYIIRRVIWVLLVMLIITVLTYLIFFVMPPTDPAVAFAGKAATPQMIAEVRHLFGLDKPLWEQYLLFVKHLFLGDRWGWPGLGFSFTTRSSVRSIIASRIIVTTQLAVGAALIWLAIGIPIGVLSALRPRTLTDRVAMGFALFGVSAPVFWLGLMALWLFWFKLGIAAGSGYVSIGTSFFGWLNHMLMPWFVLAFLFAAFYARITRAGLIETMNEDFVRTARAKGVPEWKVVLKHGLRASLTPVVTMLGMDLGTLLGGAIITETVFNLQGIGLYAVQSVYNGDLPAILAVTVIASLAISVMNLIVDIVYAFLDPRIRYT